MLTREYGVFTAHFRTYRSIVPTTQRTTLEGPALVLAEAERRDCVISRVYVSRHTDPRLIRKLECTLRQGIPVIETSAAELSMIANCRVHDGVVAVLGGKPPQRSLTERSLWFLIRFAIHDSVQSPSKS